MIVYGRRNTDHWMNGAIWVALLLNAVLFVLNLAAAAIFLNSSRKLERAAANWDAAAAAANEATKDHRAIIDRMRKRLEDAEAREQHLFPGGGPF